MECTCPEGDFTFCHGEVERLNQELSDLKAKCVVGGKVGPSLIVVPLGAYTGMAEKLETVTSERDLARADVGRLTYEVERLKCYRAAAGSLKLQVRELRKILDSIVACGDAPGGFRDVAGLSEAVDAYVGLSTSAENRDDAPERETWMVTRACQEHKRLGSDYEFRPFWGPPVTP